MTLLVLCYQGIAFKDIFQVLHDEVEKVKLDKSAGECNLEIYESSRARYLRHAAFPKTSRIFLSSRADTGSDGYIYANF